MLLDDRKSLNTVVPDSTACVAVISRTSSARQISRTLGSMCKIKQCLFSQFGLAVKLMSELNVGYLKSF